MVVLAEPEVCRQRNQSRDRKVPEEAMDKMLRAFEAPYFYEGWDAINVTYTGNGWRFPFDEAMEFSQDNPYHSLTLGEHLQAAESYARDHGFSATVQEAAAYHDIGKFYTKTFTNAQGEPSETAHFYGHENAGAYLYLCEKAANAKTREELNRVLYIASLINWHMRVMQVWKDNEKVRDRDRELIGPEMAGDLWKLFEADREAHKV